MLAVGAVGLFVSFFFSRLSFPFVGDGSIQTKILSDRAFKPKQPINQMYPTHVIVPTA